jgi:amidase/aspartyl-tRNA(Asn)/glutamyl-tRNA(Gln) amidotransferase subunit A
MGRLVNSGELLPTEIITYFLDRIEKLNPQLTAYTYTRRDEALTAAAKLEAKLAAGEYCGPFAGVPVCLKDFLPSKKGWRNSHGGVEVLTDIDQYDSEFCKAAEHLGAIVIGKTNSPAFGFSGACENVQYGATANPFDTERTSGGSSGGTASAVAAGLAIFGEGGDAGGSIRIPAGWCNLFGFKPSLGTVPSVCRPDAWAATHPYCFNGCLTKTVVDSAIMLNAMAQYNPRDPMSLPINATKDFVALMDKDISGTRIAVTFDFDLWPVVDHRIKEKTWEVAKMLESAGACINLVHFHFKHSLDDIMRTWSTWISVDSALDMMQWKSQGLDIESDFAHQVTEEFLKFNKDAAKIGIREFRHFNEVRTDILDNFEDVFDNYDLILSPTAICLPMPHHQHGHCSAPIDGKKLPKETDFISFAETALANFVGYPSASVPAGLIEDNRKKLPVGVQLIGRQYCDESIFAVARTLEQINPWIDNFNHIKSL